MALLEVLPVVWNRRGLAGDSNPILTMASQEDKNEGGCPNWLYYLKGRHVEEGADFSLWIYRGERLEYKEWKFQGDKLNQECGYWLIIISELPVTGNTQENWMAPSQGCCGEKLC